jgi:hypothetical protein
MDTHGYYYLDGHEPVRTGDIGLWGRHFRTQDRTVAYTSIATEISVSTVFLGMDHNYQDDGPPLLFETLVFGGPLDDEMERYATWDEAVEGHNVMVNRVRQALEAIDGTPGH